MRGQPAGRRGGPLRMARLAALAGEVLGPGGAGRGRAAASGRRCRRRTSTWRCWPRGWTRLFAGAGDATSGLAAAVCALSRVSVLAGGPGTGKTHDGEPGCWRCCASSTRSGGSRWPRRPARRRRGWRRRCASSTATLPAEDRARLGELHATTLHRLLGWRPEARSRFRHDRTNRLPVEVVVVDESLDGVADDDGPAARGAAADDPAGAGRRPRPARVGRGRRRAR